MKAFILSAFLAVYSFSNGQIRLPKLISNGMILQRDASLKLWGWASPYEKISLDFNTKKYQTEADKEGRWTIQLAPQKAGGPYELLFTASNKINVTNVMVGDVWICSGQSNMELTMERVKDTYPNIISSANNPDIRQFLVPDKYDFQKPDEDVESGQWIAANPENILKFSAVAYFFAADLYAGYKIPIGLINSALGGSPAEAWISEEALKKFPDHFREAQRFKDENLIAQIESFDKTNHDNWFSLLNKTDVGVKERWSSSSYNDNDWHSMNIPGYWADGETGNVNGAMWFRKEIDIPQRMTGKQGRLLLGRIVDADSAFINGTFVGTTSYLYPPRKYSVPSNVLKEGKNSISIRVINSSGRGGFVLDKPYALVVGTDTIDLKGNWKYKLGAKMDTLTRSTAIRFKPMGLFNAMIAPLVNYSIKGAIWYQGEANTKNPSEYGALLRTLITDWRAQWKQDDFPFLLVQLASFMEPKNDPAESNWAELRQAQLETLAVPNTGMAVAIDLGEWNDVHPLNKQDVGKRLALQALQVAYKEKGMVTSGPSVKSVKKDKNEMIISFSNADGGLLTSDNKRVQYFSIAGADKKFVWANAEIQGEKIILWSDAIQNPVTVRYAWADNPRGANLYNRQHLPASPFEISIK